MPSMGKRKKKNAVAGPAAEGNSRPECINSSNPFHECSDYCLRKIAEARRCHRGVLPDTSKRRPQQHVVHFHPDCINASDPYHGCSEYCFKRIALNKETTLDRENGTVMANDKFWKDNTKTKGNSEWKKLKDAPSGCLPEFTFEGADEGERDVSSMSTSGSATSPMKKANSPIIKIMKGLLESVQTTNGVAQRVMRGELMAESIQEVMRLAVESGATEESVEHFMATILFVKAEYRAMFMTMSTKEARFGWLKRWCQQSNMY